MAIETMAWAQSDGARQTMSQETSRNPAGCFASPRAAAETDCGPANAGRPVCGTRVRRHRPLYHQLRGDRPQRLHHGSKPSTIRRREVGGHCHVRPAVRAQRHHLLCCRAVFELQANTGQLSSISRGLWVTDLLPACSSASWRLEHDVVEVAVGGPDAALHCLLSPNGLRASRPAPWGRCP